jgi:hypothetical protein
MIRDKDKKILEFFGITEENVHIKRINLFSQIHEIIFHGKGGYDWETVYNMPIWLRTFTFNKLKEWYDKEQEQIDKQNNMLTNKTGKNQVVGPDITPTYNTKVPAKK